MELKSSEARGGGGNQNQKIPNGDGQGSSVTTDTLYIRNQNNEKIPVEDYFLLRSTLPFQSLNTEVTMLGGTIESDKKRRFGEKMSLLEEDSVETHSLQDRISEALENFDGSIHAIVPLVSSCSNQRHCSDIADGVFRYCMRQSTIRAEKSMKVNDASSSKPPRVKKQQNCNFGKTFNLTHQYADTAEEAVPKENIFDCKARKLDPIFCSTPAQGKLTTTIKKSRRYAKIGNGHSLRFQETHAQVLSSVQNKIIGGQISRKEATFIKNLNFEQPDDQPSEIQKGQGEAIHLITPHRNQVQDFNYTDRHQVPQVVISISSNPCTVPRGSSDKGDNNLTFSCPPKQILAPIAKPSGESGKMSFQISGTVSWI